MKRLRYILTVLLAVSFLIGPVSTASASQAEQIAQLRAMLDEQDGLDEKNAAQTDRDLARKWLQEAEVLVANGKKDAAKRRLRRVEFAVELVTSLVAAAVIRQKAEEQEAYAYTAPEQLEALQDDVDALKKKKAELQAELQQLRVQ